MSERAFVPAVAGSPAKNGAGATLRHPAAYRQMDNYLAIRRRTFFQFSFISYMPFQKTRNERLSEYIGLRRGASCGCPVWSWQSFPIQVHHGQAQGRPLQVPSFSISAPNAPVRVSRTGTVSEHSRFSIAASPITGIYSFILKTISIPVQPYFYRISSSSPYHQLPDEMLVQQYKQSKDQQFLAILYQRYNGLVFGVCLKYLKDPEAAADAGLDIYEELVGKVLKFDIDHFKAWLHTLTRNHCLMKLRSGKNKRIVELPEHLMQTEETVHLNGAMEKEEHLTKMEQCIEKLNAEQKQVVQLFYLQEKCYNDITELTGLTWKTVRSHIQNGRRNLKICMDQHAG